jgi:hypothetical protein
MCVSSSSVGRSGALATADIRLRGESQSHAPADHQRAPTVSEAGSTSGCNATALTVGARRRGVGRPSLRSSRTVGSARSYPAVGDPDGSIDGDGTRLQPPNCLSQEGCRYRAAYGCMHRWMWVDGREPTQPTHTHTRMHAQTHTSRAREYFFSERALRVQMQQTRQLRIAAHQDAPLLWTPPAPRRH